MSGKLPSDGLLLVDKPTGPTSHDVVDIARRVLSTRKIGHTGTLDPFASGLLVLCVGSATRLAEFLVGADKVYEAEIRLGMETDSGDLEGRTVREDSRWAEIDETALRCALKEWTGEIDQVPPAFSAKKVDGVRAYKRARRGESVELPPVRVRVGELELRGFDLPRVQVHVACSSGTYIRSLARDIGDTLGVGGHLTVLKRTAVGPFTVDDAVSVDALTDKVEPSVIEGAWVKPVEALPHLPRVMVGTEEAGALRHGRKVPLNELADIAVDEGEPTLVTVTCDRDLVAVASIEGSEVRPRKVFQPQ